MEIYWLATSTDVADAAALGKGEKKRKAIFGNADALKWDGWLVGCNVKWS